MRWRTCLPLIALLLAPLSALAQGVPIQAGAVTPRHAPMYVGPPFVNPGSQVVIGDSGPAGGGGIGLGLSEQLLTVPQSGSSTGPWANSGTGPFGTNWCDYDNWTTGAYHYLCLSPNAQGGALIAVGAGNGASNLPLSIIVNGITYPFPGSLSSITLNVTPVIGGTNGTCLTVNGTTVGQQTCSVSSITALTGDVTATGPGSVAATLTTVNANVGTFGSATVVPVITVNGKGLITSVSTAPVTAAAVNGVIYPATPSLNTVPVVTAPNTVTYEAVPNAALQNSTITIGGSTLALGSTVTLLAGPITFSGIENFIGTFQINGTAQSFPASGSLVGTSDTQTLINKTLSGATLSGILAGTPTLSGSNFITLANLVQGTASTLLGNPTGSGANYQNITLGATLNFSGGTTLNCSSATSSQLGCVVPDNTTITVAGGVISSIGSTATSINAVGVSGATTIVNGRSNDFLTGTPGASNYLNHTGFPYGAFASISGAL